MTILVFLLNTQYSYKVHKKIKSKPQLLDHIEYFAANVVEFSGLAQKQLLKIKMGFSL